MQLPGIGIFGGQDNVVHMLVPYLKDKGFRVEAFWALTLQEAERIGRELSIPFCTNKVDEVLLRKDVELIVILCPPNLHSQIAVKALGIGKHVLCDRPAGLSQCEALKMVLASNYYPSLICVLAFSLRFHPAFIQMKKHMAKYVGVPKLCQCRLEMGPTLGSTFNWLCDDVMGGGVVTLFGSHMIDLITYLTGQKAIRVHAVTKTLLPQTVANLFTQSGSTTRRVTATDFAVIQLEMDGGLFVSMTLSNQMPVSYFSQEISIFGTKGFLRADGAKVTGLIHSTTEKLLQRSNSKGIVDIPRVSESILYSDTEDSDFLLIDRSVRANGDFSPLLPPIYLDGLLKMLGSLREVFNIPNGTEWKKESAVGLLASGFEEGLYIQAVIEAIKDSAKGNQWSKVNILTEEPDPNPTLTAAVRTSTISL